MIFIANVICFVASTWTADGTKVISFDSTAERKEFVYAANAARASLDSPVMQCVMNWDTTLANYARNLAKKCNFYVATTPQQPYGIAMAYNYIDPATETPPRPADIIRDFTLQGFWYFQYKENNCSISGSFQRGLLYQKFCRDYRQAMWWRAKDMGCAISRCSAVTGAEYAVAAWLSVCAYTYNAVGAQGDTETSPIMPYTRGELFHSCEMCERCSHRLCCDFDWTEYDGSTRQGSEARVTKPAAKQTPSTTTSTIRTTKRPPSTTSSPRTTTTVSTTSSTTLATTRPIPSPALTTQARSTRKSCPSIPCGNGPNPSQLIELANLLNPFTNRSVLATPGSYIKYMNKGYTKKIVCGKIVKTPPVCNCPYLKPVYDLYNPKLNNHLYTMDMNVYNQKGSSGWKPLAVLGYAAVGDPLCKANVGIWNVWEDRYGYKQIIYGHEYQSIIMRKSSSILYCGRSFAIWP